jgi:universal stress protein A
MKTAIHLQEAIAETEKLGSVESLGQAEEPISDLKRILVPIDLSAESYKALKYAFRLAKQFSSQVFLLHVVSHESSEEVYNVLRFEEINERLKEELHRKLLETNADQRPEASLFTISTIRKGHPHQEICSTARDLSIDLIVMGTHGYTGFKRARLGSVAEKTIRYAPCPVMVVREKEREFIK